MATLTVTLNAERMPNSTQLFRQAKAVEHLYYANLYGTAPYSGSPDTWLAWLQMGFAAGLKEPPASRREDRLHRTVRSEGRLTEIRVSTPNEEALRTLASLLRDLEALRPSVAGKSDADRVKVLEATNPIHTELVKPLLDALRHAELRKAEVDNFAEMVDVALAALTDNEIVSTEITFSDV
jgi:hypothetical protein